MTSAGDPVCWDKKSICKMLSCLGKPLYTFSPPGWAAAVLCGGVWLLEPSCRMCNNSLSSASLKCWLHSSYSPIFLVWQMSSLVQLSHQHHGYVPTLNSHQRVDSWNFISFFLNTLLCKDS